MKAALVAQNFRRYAIKYLSARIGAAEGGLAEREVSALSNKQLRRLLQTYIGNPHRQEGGKIAEYLFFIGKLRELVPKPKNKDFYRSDNWRAVRYQALKRSQGCCECCGAHPILGKPLHVDHIKPRSRYPHLELDGSNLQVLCVDCNLGKSARDETDWRGNVVPFPNVMGL